MSKTNTADFLQWDLSTIHDAFIKKELSPVEVTQAVLSQIEEKDKELNSFITVVEEEALAQARQAEEEILKGNIKGPLHGVPIGLKDIIYTKGIRTTFGSERYKDFVPTYDAEVVSRLKGAGSILVGKLNLHQFAYGTTGDRSYFGPVKNPHNLNKITGGSSSGSGASVAGNLVYGAIGSDTGGSIRIPASCCGIVGMKPTFGLVSKRGVMTLSWTLDHLGPMTRTVKDNALLLNCMVGYDSKDAYSVQTARVNYAEDLDKGIEGLKIGVPTTFFFDIIHPEVLDIFNKNLDELKQKGVEIHYIDLPHMDELLIAQQMIIATEGFAALEKEVREAPELIDPEVCDRIISGMLVQANEYLHMLQVKHLAIQSFKEVLDQVDLIMTPTLCTVPSEIEGREMQINDIVEHPRILARLTGPSNTLGFPAISVNGGFSVDGLPVGIQFIGLPFDEKTLYRVAYAVEQAK